MTLPLLVLIDQIKGDSKNVPGYLCNFGNWLKDKMLRAVKIWQPGYCSKTIALSWECFHATSSVLIMQPFFHFRLPNLLVSREFSKVQQRRQWIHREIVKTFWRVCQGVRACLSFPWQGPSTCGLGRTYRAKLFDQLMSRMWRSFLVWSSSINWKQPTWSPQEGQYKQGQDSSLCSLGFPKMCNPETYRFYNCISKWKVEWTWHLVVENWIRYGKAAQEGPHICILPSQHRVNPHHLVKYELKNG